MIDQQKQPDKPIYFHHYSFPGAPVVTQPSLPPLKKRPELSHIIRLYADGHSFRQIEKITGVPRTTLHRKIHKYFKQNNPTKEEKEKKKKKEKKEEKRESKRRKMSHPNSEKIINDSSQKLNSETKSSSDSSQDSGIE